MPNQYTKTKLKKKLDIEVNLENYEHYMNLKNLTHPGKDPDNAPIKGMNGRKKTYEIFHVYCIFYSGFMCQTTVLF